VPRLVWPFGQERYRLYRLVPIRILVSAPRQVPVIRKYSVRRLSGALRGRSRGTVYDASSGAEITFYQFQPPNTSGIKDVVLTRHAAYFTTSPILYRVALGPRGKPSENFGKPCARNGPRCRSGALLTRAAPRAIISASTSDRPRRARSGMTGIPSTKSPFIRLSVPSLQTNVAGQPGHGQTECPRPDAYHT
jgi:hypothetical protein